MTATRTLTVSLIQVLKLRHHMQGQFTDLCRPFARIQSPHRARCSHANLNCLEERMPGLASLLAAADNRYWLSFSLAAKLSRLEVWKGRILNLIRFQISDNGEHARILSMNNSFGWWAHHRWADHRNEHPHCLLCDTPAITKLERAPNLGGGHIALLRKGKGNNRKPMVGISLHISGISLFLKLSRRSFSGPKVFLLEHKYVVAVVYEDNPATDVATGQRRPI